MIFGSRFAVCETTRPSQPSPSSPPSKLVAPESPAPQIWTARRAAVLVIAYFAALATLVLTRGVHISSDRYFLILLVPAIALGLTRQYLRDWVPFIALMIAYEFARGGAEWLNADILGRGPFYAPMIDVDRALFFGAMPPEFVQSWFWTGTSVPFDWVIGSFNKVHFFVPPTLLFLIWLDRRRALRPVRHGDRDHVVHRRGDLLPVPGRAAVAGLGARADPRRVDQLAAGCGQRAAEGLFLHRVADPAQRRRRRALAALRLCPAHADDRLDLATPRGLRLPRLPAGDVVLDRLSGGSLRRGHHRAASPSP